MARSLADALVESVGAISEQLRLRFTAPADGADGGDRLGLVALATLRHLVRHGPRSVTQLAEADAVTTQAISLRVAPLVERGLVQRSRDPHDARTTVLRATAAGERTVASAQRRGRRALVDAVAGLSPADRQALRGALPALEHLGDALRDLHTPAHQSPGGRHDGPASP